MISAILAALAYLGALVVAEFVSLVFDTLVDWFRRYAARSVDIPDEVAVTVAEHIRAGSVSIVQGVFNTTTENFTPNTRRVSARGVDQRVRDLHRGNQVVIWE